MVGYLLKTALFYDRVIFKTEYFTLNIWACPHLNQLKLQGTINPEIITILTINTNSFKLKELILEMQIFLVVQVHQLLKFQ